jgi:hypothetical protein
MREKCRARYGNGRLITPAEIQLISGFEFEIAVKEHEYIRKLLGTESEDLLVSQYCEYAKLNYAEVMTFLNPHKRRFFSENEAFSGEKNE